MVSASGRRPAWPRHPADPVFPGGLWDHQIDLQQGIRRVGRTAWRHGDCHRWPGPAVASSHVLNVRGESYRLREKRQSSLPSTDQPAFRTTVRYIPPHWKPIPMRWVKTKPAIVGQFQPGVDTWRTLISHGARSPLFARWQTQGLADALVPYKVDPINNTMPMVVNLHLIGAQIGRMKPM